MRDYLVLLLIFAGSAAALKHPYIGAYTWTWLSIMNPHRLGWGAAVNFPVAMVVAIATLTGLVISRDPKRLPITAATVTLGCFVLWMCITTIFAVHSTGSWEQLDKVIKIQLMVFVTLAVLHTRQQIQIFVWVNVASLGFFGVKGGLFTITTGGSFRVWGPPGSFIEGNNEIALALILLIPLLRYLQLIATKPWLKHALTAAMLLSALAALGSHSRGALLAIAAMALWLWFKSRNKLPFGILIVLIGLSLIVFMPENWSNRMNTINNYQEDSSAMGRINAWWMCFNLAKDRFLGGGFDIYTPDFFAAYAPNPADIHAAHSIYFQVLGEHGFIGLLLFLLVWFFTWRTATWVQRQGKKHPDTQWTSDLAAMIQVSLIGYAVGGAFLSLAYFDLPYNMLIIMVLTQRWLQEWQPVQTAAVLIEQPSPWKAAT
ncbi:MAG: putative O-glycosylation ligase, exosortase A system-associated [Candidatus Competibacteraceae bacterium]|nr:putative O-glycosylation ligase, exosortase A system-associated [Candidatus Competibacteraceae bacterium]